MSFVERLQLTPEEKQIYQILLGFGQLTAFEIAQFSKLHYSKVSIALNSLKGKGAVGISEGYIQKYFVRIPLDYLGETSDRLNENIKGTLNQSTSFFESKKATLNELKTNLSTSIEQSITTKEAEIDQQHADSSSAIQASNQQQRESINQKTDLI